MMKKIIVASLFLLVSMSSAWAQPSSSSPVEMLQSTSDNMINALKQNHQKIDSDPRVIYGLARNILLPHVDVKAMSRLALGRDNWKQANPHQRDMFVKQFTDLLIRTYATALAAYTNETIKFKPLRGDISHKKRIQVDSFVYQRGGPAIPVSYRLLLRNDDWKVYDMTVDGVSMVQSFRSQFSSAIAQNGLDGLLREMDKHVATH